MVKASTELPHLPITQFYMYMWENDKMLLLKSLLVNYMLPLVLELLPYVFLPSCSGLTLL